MKEEYVNAFLSPAKLVWEKELGCALDLIGAEAVSNQFTTEQITAIIGVSGRLEGNVLYGFSDSTAYAVASQMIGEPVTELDDLGLSALGEIANMITGNAATPLAAAGSSTHNVGGVLSISPRPADAHRTNLRRRLGFHSQADLIRYALRRGIISIEA